MKKATLATVFILLISTSLIAQHKENRKWDVSFGMGLQAHDKRLFDFPPKEDVLARQPEVFGAYQWSAGIHRIFQSDRRTSFTTGIGLSTEIATFSRPFDHNYFTGKGTYELRFTDNYQKWLVQVPVAVRYSISRQYSIRTEVLSQINLLTVAKHSSFDKTYTKFDPCFYAAEFNIGMHYAISPRVGLGISYRLFQIKAIDKVLFNDILRDPRQDENWETFNPFKLWFTVVYAL